MHLAYELGLLCEKSFLFAIVCVAVAMLGVLQLICWPFEIIRRKWLVMAKKKEIDVKLCGICGGTGMVRAGYYNPELGALAAKQKVQCRKCAGGK